MTEDGKIEFKEYKKYTENVVWSLRNGLLVALPQRQPLL